MSYSTLTGCALSALTLLWGCSAPLDSTPAPQELTARSGEDPCNDPRVTSLLDDHSAKRPEPFAVDGDEVFSFWRDLTDEDYGEIVATPRTGGPSRSVFNLSGGGGGGGFLAGGYVYWSESYDGTTTHSRVPKEGGEAEVIARYSEDTDGIVQLASSRGHLYGFYDDPSVDDNERLYEMELDGSGRRLIAGPMDTIIGSRMLVDDSSAYFMSRSTGGMDLLSINLDDGTMTTLASITGTVFRNPRALTQRGDALVWIEGAADLMTVPKAGGQDPALLVRLPAGRFGRPAANDSLVVYGQWSAAPGRFEGLFGVSGLGGDPRPIVGACPAFGGMSPMVLDGSALFWQGGTGLWTTTL